MVAGPTIGGCRTFFENADVALRFMKPKTSAVSTADKANTKHYLFKQRGAGTGPPAFERFFSIGERAAGRSQPPEFSFRANCLIDSRENRATWFVFAVADFYVENFPRLAMAQHRRVSVQSRRSHADRSPAPANERRSTGDQRSTCGGASESPGVSQAIRDTTSQPPPRPPIHGRHRWPFAASVTDAAAGMGGRGVPRRWSALCARRRRPPRSGSTLPAKGQAAMSSTPGGRPVCPGRRPGGRAVSVRSSVG